MLVKVKVIGGLYVSVPLMLLSRPKAKWTFKQNGISLLVTKMVVVIKLPIFISALIERGKRHTK